MDSLILQLNSQSLNLLYILINSYFISVLKRGLRFPRCHWTNFTKFECPIRQSIISINHMATCDTRTEEEITNDELLTEQALVCGPGLPDRLFFEMDGVFISSRFFRVNIFKVPFPSILTSLSLPYSPPTHPPTRHLCVRPVNTGTSAPSNPTFTHESCLSTFLLLSHMECAAARAH